MTARTLVATFALGVVAVLAAGCGDNKPVIYKQGNYQGKPDSKPWDNDLFKGNQVEWDKAIKARNQIQNEYSRAISSAK